MKLNVLGEIIPETNSVYDKNVPFQTFLHYSDPLAQEKITVFGKSSPELFYNYSDRIDGEKWRRGLVNTAKVNTARYFELALNYFHDTDDVNLCHVVLGCNRVNGYSYLIFGYTLTEGKLKQ